MAVYRRSARPRFTLLLLVLTSVTLITLDFRGDAAGVFGAARNGVRDVLAPVQSAVNAAVRPIGNVVRGIARQGELEAENARLRQQLEEARGEALRAADADRERKTLLDLQNLDFVGDIPSVAARVVSTTSSNFELTVVVDRGTAAGVAEGMPVVSGAGLVGRVVTVSRNRAVVLLITDRTSSVGLRLTSSGEVGVATGRGRRNTLDADLISPQTKVSKGEVVVTSGLQQSVFPPGIPVGTVSSATSRKGRTQQDVQIEPSVDLHRLSFVRILQWNGLG